MSDSTPLLASLVLPLDNAAAADVATQLRAEFTLPVSAGAGYITVRSYADDSVAVEVDVTSDMVVIDGTTVTVTLPEALEQGTHYYVTIDEGALIRAQSEDEATLLFSEDFEGLASALGPYVSPSEGGGDGTDWTATLPAGWTQDNQSLPGGPAEFYGWTFHDVDAWAETAGDQDRTQFAAASGVVAVADPDEYDDGDVSLGTDGFDAELVMPAIDVSAVGDGKIVLEFASSWRPEDAQEAYVWASFDGGEQVAVLHYSSDETSADYKPDATSETVRIELNVPEGASALVFSFDMPAAGNDWWWAIDNVRVLSYPVSAADKFPGLTDKDAWDFTTWAEDELVNLFSEDWEGVSLGAFDSATEMRGDGTDWAASAAGWTVVNDIPAGGVAEFAGWTFLDATSWSRTAWDQLRSDFADTHDTVAVADPDEYFDAIGAPVAEGYASTLLSPEIDVSGVTSGRLRLSFDSSWRPAGDKAAQITIAFDGGAPVVLDLWSSDPASADFHNTATDETLTYYIDLPAGAVTAQIGFALAEAGDDWWWAVDNVSLDEVVLNAAPEAVNDAAAALSRASLRLDLLANDAEPNGEAMTVTAIDTTGTAGSVTQNDDGTVTWAPAGAFAWLAEGETATTSFAYTVSDASGLSSTATATITVTGQAAGNAGEAFTLDTALGTVAFDGDAFVFDGMAHDSLDALMTAAVEAFGGTVKLAGEIDDHGVAGGAQINALVFAETRVTLRSDAVDGLFRAKFDDAATARAFDGFADAVLAEVQDKAALATDPDSFAFDIGGSRVFFDAGWDKFGLTDADGSPAAYFDRLERFVEAIVTEEGGTLTQTANFFERVIAWGTGDEVEATATGHALTVAGRGLARDFTADFASEAEAQAMAEGLNRLFDEIAAADTLPASFLTV